MRIFKVYVYDKLIKNLLLCCFDVETVNKKNALKLVKNEMANEGHDINTYIFRVIEMK